MTDDEKARWSEINIHQPIESLVQHGPTLKVGISGVPFTGDNIIQAAAQIDTGASNCGISERLIKRLSLEPLPGEFLTVEAGREPIARKAYWVRLRLPVMEVEVEAYSLPSLTDPHDFLIGRDVLANCRIMVDFTSGQVKLHFRA